MKLSLRRTLPKSQQIKFLSTILRQASKHIPSQEIAKTLMEFGSKTHKRIGAAAFYSIESGNSFTDGIRPWLDQMAWESLKAGEVTGDWASGIRSAIETLESSYASGGQLLSVLGKPAIGVSVLLGISALVSSKLFPLLSESSRGKVRMNGISALAQDFGNFWAEWGSAIGISIVVLFLVIIVSLPIWIGRVRESFGNIPFYRQYRLIQTASVLRSLGNLTAAGISLKAGLESLKSNATPYLKYHLSFMLDKLDLGEENLGVIVDTGLVNKAEVHVIKILGNLGEQSYTLHTSADYIIEIIKDEAQLIKSVCSNFLLIVGVGVGLLMGMGVILYSMDIALRF
ncbi:type II secretion system F family protein [Shewanella algae]|uniref:type II secretion system F family protein n=1 Tax=Shewanella algae TaxID=38313 RepID=UPI00300521C5